MSLFDVLSKGFCSKKRESNEILSQEEYKDKFLHGDEYIKRELYDEYISRRLSEEFGLKYNEKIKNGTLNGVLIGVLWSNYVIQEEITYTYAGDIIMILSLISIVKIS